MNTKKEKLMTPTQLAAALGVSYGTVVRWKKLGCPYKETRENAPFPRGSRPLYELQKVKDWLEKKKTDQTQEAKKKCLSPYKNISVINTVTFKGCRMCIQERGFCFTRYFSLNQYNTMSAALEAACALRDRLRNELLGKNGQEVYSLLQEFRKMVLA